MRAFAQKPVRPHQDLPAKSSVGGKSVAAGLATDNSGFEEPTTETATGRVGHDFSQIAVYSPSERSAASGPGRALPASLRDRFEGSLGADLSAVRLHTGSASARAAQAAHAQAFALGHDIHFSGGAYDPVSGEGQRILAHEVAHTVQQANAAGLPHGMTAPGDAAETQADAAAPAMVAGQRARVSQQPAAIARILEKDLPQPQIVLPPGLLAACPTLADWRKLKLDQGLPSLVEAYKATYVAGLAYDAANKALDTAAGAKPSQGVADEAQKAAADYSRSSTELSVECRRLASQLFAPKLNLDPAAPEPVRPAPPQTAPGINTPPPQAQPGLTADPLAAKLGNELIALADRQGGIISGAVRSSRHAKQAVANFLPQYRETLPFAWSTVQEANDEAMKSWFAYYELDLPRDKSQPRNTGDDASVFFNGKDTRYGDVLDTFISEGNKAGFTFNREHAWEVTGNILSRRQNLQDGATEGPEKKPSDKKKLAAPSVALQSQLNFTGHRTLVRRGATNSQDPPTWQVTGQITVPLHPEGQSGFEISAQGSVSFVMTRDGKIVAGTLQLSDPKATVTNVQGALQLAWVKPFLEGAIQFQAFAQVVGGASWVEDSVNVNSGTVTLKAAGMIQGVAGTQLVFVIPDTGQHVQLYIQLQTSVTGTSGQPSTLDLQGTGGVQIQFNLF
jgi:hypothetical protein